MNKYLLTTLSLLFFSNTSWATSYRHVDVRNSYVHFIYSQMGVELDASFKRLSGTLDFDTDKPADAKAFIKVDLSSVDTGAIESDDEVLGKDWLFIKKFPHATFEISTAKQLSDLRYEVIGKLEIKGIVHNVSFPVELTKQDDKAVIRGQFTIERSSYTVGIGAWANFDIVANPVTVKFQITARPNT